MKKLLLALSVCICMLCACGAKEQPEQPASPTATPTEVPKSPLEIVRETLEKEDVLCGVAFLSYFEGEYLDAMAEWERAGLFETYPFLSLKDGSLAVGEGITNIGQ